MIKRITNIHVVCGSGVCVKTPIFQTESLPMEKKHGPFVEKLASYLSYAEIGALLVSFIGLSFFYLRFTGGREFILAGFTALSMSYFLLAFTTPEAMSEDESDDAKGGSWIYLLKRLERR